jgi:hypothetical protein
MAPAEQRGSWPPRVAAGAGGGRVAAFESPCGGAAARPGPSTVAAGRRAQCPEAGGLVVNRERGKHCGPLIIER